MKKTIIAALSSLMLAGAICAVSGATPTREAGMVVILGDGTTPYPAPPPSVSLSSDRSSFNK